MTHVVATLLASFLLAGEETPGPQYPDHSKLLVHRDEQNREMPVKTKEDWLRRRKHILAGMEQAMGPLPSRKELPPLDMQVTEEFAGDGYKRLTVSFVSSKEDNDRIPAYLYLPASRPAGQRVAAMLALHPTGAPGKGIVDGNGKANRYYGKELAQRGYVVLAPDYPSFGDLAKYDFAADRYVSGTMKGIVNHMRCVDLLQSREEVDPTRIGVIGHSLGGHNSMFVAVFDERLKVVVSSCGWCPFHDYYGGKIAGWTSDRYMPRLRDVYGLDPSKVPFDFYEIVAALAPRAFFSVSPVRDSNFDVNGVKKAIPAAKPIYDLFAAGDNLQVRYPDCEHDFPDDSRREAYAFIDKILSHTPTRQIPEAAKVEEGLRGLQGNWSFVAMERGGKKPPEQLLATVKVVIKDDTFTITDGKNGESATFKLDPAMKLREIDLVFKEGPNKDVIRKALGIYELNGDSLKLAWRKDGGARPTEFSSIQGERTSELLILKREKSE